MVQGRPVSRDLALDGPGLGIDCSRRSARARHETRTTTHRSTGVAVTMAANSGSASAMELEKYMAKSRNLDRAQGLFRLEEKIPCESIDSPSFICHDSFPPSQRSRQMMETTALRLQKHQHREPIISSLLGKASVFAEAVPKCADIAHATSLHPRLSPTVASVGGMGADEM